MFIWLVSTRAVFLLFFFLMIRRPPRSTLFPTRRSSDLTVRELPAVRRVAGGVRAGAIRGVARRGGARRGPCPQVRRSEEHTSELQSRLHLVCRLLLEKKKT